MEITYNQRGFGHIEFTDDRGNKCSMQESSSVDIRLWLGIDNPRIVNFSKGTPFEVPTPEGCSVFGRMELSQEMVQRMLPALHCFAQTGAIAPDWEDVVDDQTKHPLWAEWLSWYGHHYTTRVPIRNGMPDNLDQRLSWDTYKAARTDVVSEVPDLNREWKFKAECDCGCNTPAFTEPMEALRFLMHRMNSAGVSSAVGVSYAHDIMQILKQWNAVESDPALSTTSWTSMSTKRPANATQIVFVDGQSEIGLAYYMEEDAEQWPNTVRYLTYKELSKLPVN